MVTELTSPSDLAERIDSALPQTQCTRCAYDDCASYAQAVACGAAGINQCPPGGTEGIARLAGLTGRPFEPQEVEPPLLTDDLQERQVGGLGLHFMRTLMDDVVFEFSETGNTVTMSRRISTS